MSKQITHDRQAFHTWLEGRDPGDTVGWAGISNRCPYAAFQRIQYGWDYASVGAIVTACYMDAMDQFQSRANPRWLDQFVHDIDRDCDGRSGGRVTREDALRVLDQIAEE